MASPVQALFWDEAVQEAVCLAGPNTRSALSGKLLTSSIFTAEAAEAIVPEAQLAGHMRAIPNNRRPCRTTMSDGVAAPTRPDQAE